MVSTVLVQPDGKMLLFATKGDAGPMVMSLVLVRLLPTGKLDTAFGTNGIFEIQPAGNWGSASSVLDSQGRVVATATKANHFVVMRLAADGKLDPQFGGGVVDLGTGIPGGVWVEPSGAIYVAGSLGGTFVVARLTGDGKLDPSFGGTGVGGGSFPSDSHGQGVTVHKDGTVLAVGNARTSPTSYDRLVVRYRQDGQLDSTFGVGGIARTGGMGSTVTVQSACHLLVGGRSSLLTRYAL
jgi:uncharacterized delta-60 repeat protein